MIKVSAIILAAGKGARFKSKISKPLAKVGGKSVLSYSLRTLEGCPQVTEIIVTANSANLAQIKKEVQRLGSKKTLKCVLGGRERQDSVACGLGEVSKEAQLVLIHDAARPFIDKKSILAVIELAQTTGAAIVAVPVKSTIKKVKTENLKLKDKFVVEDTLERKDLWEVQTPQVFRQGLLLMAYRQFGKLSVTDDASLVEKLGVKVGVVEGSYSNIKITTPDDLVIAEAIARNLKLKSKK